MIPDAAPLLPDIRCDPLIPARGLVWRWGRFTPDDRRGLIHGAGDGRLRLSLPPDLQQAVAKRRSEYLAGRLCATLALRACGSDEPVGRQGRAPVWPEGLGGSISHSDTLAVAVVTRAHSHIGVDCETVVTAQSAAQIAPLVLGDADRAAQPAGMAAPTYLTVVFSAKEALYKALSQDLADIPDFHEAAVTAFGADRLSLRFRGADVTVRWAQTQGHCLTLALPGH